MALKARWCGGYAIVHYFTASEIITKRTFTRHKNKKMAEKFCEMRLCEQYLLFNQATSILAAQWLTTKLH